MQSSQFKNSSNTLLDYLIEKKKLLKKYAVLPQPEGRNSELRKILETLLCYENNNVLISGLSGVGKSSLIDKASFHILGYDAEGFFKQMPLLQLDYVRLMSDCNSKNDVEKKLIEIFRQISSSPVILIIEDIQYLCDKNQGLPGAFMILKEFLRCDNIRVVASCSMASLKKTFNADEAFIKNFNVIELAEPDNYLLKNILKNRARVFQKSTAIKINPSSINEAIVLSKKYFRETALPLSAIQLIEKSFAGISLNTDEAHKKYLLKVLDAYKSDCILFEKENQPETIATYKLKTINNLNESIKHLTGYPLFEEDFTNEKPALTYYEQIDKHFNHFLSELNVTELLPLHVASTCAMLTGIPAGKISQNEHEKLSNLGSKIKEVVKGQDHAIELIVRKLKTWRMNLSTTKTVGSFFLLGPTGTGKTELTKALAANLFDDANAFIRFDMSEFKEEHSAALLIGAPPGYVGYEEGGLLVNKIRQKPHAVVLFDEIEKAHHTVFDLFLQIMDEGKLHDKLGFEGDFSNAIVIFTSNIASNLIQEAVKTRSITELTQAELTDMVSEYAKATHYIIKPEFLGRLSAIVPFAPINSVLHQILELNLSRFSKNLFYEHGVRLKINSTFVDHIVRSNLEFEKYGARKIKHTVQTELIEPVAEFLFNNSVVKNTTLEIDYWDKLKIEIASTETL
ncbi:MAG: ATP-dependent Clp protease ATP-binding subunit [Bacteroidetes bacterium]|nr:ATP-dependent Clp protease ATP-binding subunit [Bacteroidota bacterium]